MPTLSRRRCSRSTRGQRSSSSNALVSLMCVCAKQGFPHQYCRQSGLWVGVTSPHSLWLHVGEANAHLCGNASTNHSFRLNCPPVHLSTRPPVRHLPTTDWWQVKNRLIRRHWYHFCELHIVIHSRCRNIFCSLRTLSLILFNSHTYTWRHTHKHSFHGNRNRGLFMAGCLPRTTKNGFSSRADTRCMYGY